MQTSYFSQEKSEEKRKSFFTFPTISLHLPVTRSVHAPQPREKGGLVRWSVHQTISSSVCQSIDPLVRPLVRPSVVPWRILTCVHASLWEGMSIGPAVSLSVCLSVGPSVCWSVRPLGGPHVRLLVRRLVCNAFFLLLKNGGKWSKMTFIHPQNLSFNLPLLICLLISFLAFL